MTIYKSYVLLMSISCSVICLFSSHVLWAFVDFDFFGTNFLYFPPQTGQPILSIGFKSMYVPNSPWYVQWRIQEFLKGVGFSRWGGGLNCQAPLPPPKKKKTSLRCPLTPLDPPLTSAMRVPDSRNSFYKRNEYLLFLHLLEYVLYL